MKKSFIIIALILMLFGISACSESIYEYEQHGKYITSSEFIVDVSITTIEVSWVNGNVNFIENDLSSINIKEENGNKNPLSYYVDGSTLKIEYVEYGTKQSVYSSLKKDLTISVPSLNKSDTNINVKIVNGNCNFSSNTFYNTIDIELVNGNANIDFLSANKVEIKTVNGDITINMLTVDSLSIEKVNGNLQVKQMGKPMNINIKSVSGTDTIYIYVMFGYTVETDAILKFDSEFDNLTSVDPKLVQISYNAVSGTLVIKKQ